jgi:hypothetical protein
MKFANTLSVILIVSFCVAGNSLKRERRTVGTLLQFFGLKLVPLTESDKANAEKQSMQLQYPGQANRNPKLIKLSTVMPSTRAEFETLDLEDSSLESEKMSSKFAPLTSSEGTTQMPTTTTQQSSPFMIVLPNIPTSSEKPTTTSTEEPTLNFNFPSTSESVQMEITTKMSSPEEDIDPRINEDDDVFDPLPLGISTFGQSVDNEINGKLIERESSEIKMPLEDTKLLSEDIKIPNEVLKTLSEDIKIPSEVMQKEEPTLDQRFSSEHQQYQNLQNIPMQKSHQNFEIYRSKDVTNTYFGQQSFPSAHEVFPQHLQPPAPFMNHKSQNSHAVYRYPAPGSSTASMNINGQLINYMTYHH